MEFYSVTAKKSRNSFRLVFCLFAFLFLLSASARAALQFDVFLGYDNILPGANWFPIACELKNDGPPFQAVIEISSEQFGEGHTIRVPIELPTDTRKRVFIPAFSASRRGSWNARLVDSRGRVRAEQSNISPKKFNASEVPVVGALSRTLAGAPSFPNVRSSQSDFQPTTARLQAGIFPDNPLALEGLSVLYLNPQKALDLNVTQVSALLTWLQKGGHLIVGLEQLGDVSATPWLHDLLPCELKEVGVSKSNEQLENWLHLVTPTAPAARSTHRANPSVPQQHAPSFNANSVNSNQSTNPFVTLEPDPQFDTAEMPVVNVALREAKVLIGTEQFPLVIQTPRGRGKVTVLLFSPEREPFVSWRNRAWFWTKLCHVPERLFETTDMIRQGGYFSSDGIFGAMIDSKQVRKLPLGWLLALLVAYLLVIGPIDQYWLKKINKQMLTWITFPCYVVLFSGLIYFIGFHLRAGDSEWNELNVVDILPNGERAVLRGQTYASIYSPNNSWYPLVAEQPFASLRGEFLANYRGESSRGRVEQHGNNFSAEVFVPVWTSQLFVSDWLQQSATCPLLMTAKAEGHTWHVTVENKTDRKLSSVHAVLGARVYELGNLATGEKHDYTLELNGGAPIPQFVHTHGNRFWEVAQSRQYTFGNNRPGLTDIPRSSMAVSFVSMLNSTEDYYRNFSYPEALDLSRFAAEGKNILLAWDADHTFVKELNRFSPRRLHRDTLLRLVQ